MEKIKQGLILSLILLAGCSSTEVKKAPVVAKGPALTDAQIRLLIVDKTMLVTGSSGSTWDIKSNADGTVTGARGSDTDTGTYTIKDGKYCSEWNEWRDGSKACWTIHRRADDHYGELISGPSNSFKFIVIL